MFDRTFIIVTRGPPCTMYTLRPHPLSPFRRRKIRVHGRASLLISFPCRKSSQMTLRMVPRTNATPTSPYVDLVPPGARLKSPLPSRSISRKLSCNPRPLFPLDRWTCSASHLAMRARVFCVYVCVCMRAFTTTDGFCDPDRWGSLSGAAGQLCFSRRRKPSLTWFHLLERPPRTLSAFDVSPFSFGILSFRQRSCLPRWWRIFRIFLNI